MVIKELPTVRRFCLDSNSSQTSVSSQGGEHPPGRPFGTFGSVSRIGLELLLLPMMIRQAFLNFAAGFPVSVEMQKNIQKNKIFKNKIWFSLGARMSLSPIKNY